MKGSFVTSSSFSRGMKINTNFKLPTNLNVNRKFHTSSVLRNEIREFSPIFTERATNFNDDIYKKSVQSISSTLKQLFEAHSVALVPGSGTAGMESVVRQFGENKRLLYLRHGYFGYRWEEIITQGKITSQLTTLLGKEVSNGQYGPTPIEEVEQKIASEKPEVVFFSHVDTSTGILCPDDYIKRVTAAGHKVGAIVVLDCIASGSLWAGMKSLDLDVVVTAPQKGLSAQASSGIVLLNERVRKTIIDKTTSSSYSLDLKRWVNVMETFEQGGVVYHATPPTDAIITINSGLKDIQAFGFEKAKQTQKDLGAEIRKILSNKGLKSVAVSGNDAPSVIVFYTPEDPVATVGKFRTAGMKVGGALSFMLGEKEKPKTFRVGLLGIDKMKNKEATIQYFQQTLDKVFPK